MIVVLAESIKALLLAIEGRLGRTRGLGLERAMHALMCAVLLGMPRNDALHADAEPKPPEGKTGKPCQSGRCEWTSVI